MVLSEWGFILKAKCLLSICEVQNTVSEMETTEKGKHTKQAEMAPSLVQLGSRRDTNKGGNTGQLSEGPTSLEYSRVSRRPSEVGSSWHPDDCRRGVRCQPHLVLHITVLSCWKVCHLHKAPQLDSTLTVQRAAQGQAHENQGARSFVCNMPPPRSELHRPH